MGVAQPLNLTYMVYSLGGQVLQVAAKITQGLRLHFRPERTAQIRCSPCDIGQATVLVYMLKQSPDYCDVAATDIFRKVSSCLSKAVVGGSQLSKVAVEL